MNKHIGNLYKDVKPGNQDSALGSCIVNACFGDTSLSCTGNFCADNAYSGCVWFFCSGKGKE